MPKSPDRSAGVSGPNLKLAMAGSHSWHSAQRSQHYHEVVVGKTESGPNKMTQRRGQKDNNEESDEKL
jgi:hypothetical protein